MAGLITNADYRQYASAWVTVSRALDRAREESLDHQPRRALSLLNTAVNLAERDLAPMDRLFTDVRGAYVLALFELKKYRQFRHLAGSAIRHLSRTHGPDSPEVLKLRARQRQLPQLVTPRRERPLVAALQRAEDTERHKGPQDKATTRAWFKVAAAYRKADRYDDMLQLYEERINDTRRELGADHPDVALLAQTAAEDAWQLGHVQPAAQLYAVYYAAEKTHADSEGAPLGAYGAASLRHQMASFHLAAFDPDEAEPVLRDGLRILDTHTIGPRSVKRAEADLRPMLEHGLGTALCQQLDGPNASKHFYRAFENAQAIGSERDLRRYFTCAVFAGEQWREHLRRP
ncbi:tetratricopeptide repeat protein [Streptomyces sp. ME19-01-6]|uniref:tetratricopeptide repeat protein n=1 Tax=Streptomyces sp. ME19-01-6 TaxID=3028686 RepID=UPI0029B732FD|nr:tetratricopeptide repeat protein [Streptomyces sp. ME19-01-6]MDX3229208.1 tetratricopeptide repeat protein [Streptomyces sp. ME19-01-6]